MPYYINAEQAADYFAALRANLPHYTPDFHTRDSMLLNAEQTIRSTPFLTLLLWDSIQIGDCDACRWRHTRHQKCSCCRRNRNMKDNFEEENNGTVD